MLTENEKAEIRGRVRLQQALENAVYIMDQYLSSYDEEKKDFYKREMQEFVNKHTTWDLECLNNYYSIGSIQLEGKGVDRYIFYIEKEDGTPLTEKEMDELHNNDKLHTELIQCKLLR